MKKAIKLLGLGLTIAFSTLSLTSCGDDKKDDENDSESATSKKDDVCACIGLAKDAYLRGDDLELALETACKDLKHDPEIQKKMMDCPEFMELVNAAEKISDAEEAIEEEMEEYEEEVDENCEELLDKYEDFMEEYSEKTQELKDNPTETTLVTEYQQFALEAAEFATELTKTNCYLDEDFNQRMEEIEEKYKID